MAPFLDTSLDATNHQRDSGARPPPSKQPSSKDKSRQDANGGQLGGDQSRPRTSTGIRAGNQMFHPKIGVSVDDSSNQMQQPSLPTKSNYMSYQPPSKLSAQATNVLKGASDKNENLRGQLRRSYDANSGNLPHPHGI